MHGFYVSGDELAYMCVCMGRGCSIFAWKRELKWKITTLLQRIRESWMNFPFFDLVAIHYCTRCRIEQNSLPSVSVDCQHFLFFHLPLMWPCRNVTVDYKHLTTKVIRQRATGGENGCSLLECALTLFWCLLSCKVWYPLCQSKPNKGQTYITLTVVV